MSLAPIAPTAVLVALIARLRAYAPLTAVVGQRVYNHAPQDGPLPFVRVRVDSEEWDTKDSFGSRDTITCSIWSDQHGDRQPLEIAGHLIDALHLKQLSLSGGAQSLLLRRQRVIVQAVTDGVSHQTVVVFDHISTR